MIEKLNAYIKAVIVAEAAAGDINNYDDILRAFANKFYCVFKHASVGNGTAWVRESTNSYVISICDKDTFVYEHLDEINYIDDSGGDNHELTLFVASIKPDDVVVLLTHDGSVAEYTHMNLMKLAQYTRIASSIEQFYVLADRTSNTLHAYVAISDAGQEDLYGKSFNDLGFYRDEDDDTPDDDRLE